MTCGDFDDQNAMAREVGDYFSVPAESLPAVPVAKKVILGEGQNTIEIDAAEFAKAFEHTFRGQFRNFYGEISPLGVRYLSESAAELGYLKTSQALRHFGDNLSDLTKVKTESGKLWEPPATLQQIPDKPEGLARASDVAQVQSEVLEYFHQEV